MTSSGLSGCGWWSETLVFSTAAVVSWLVTQAIIPVLQRWNVVDIPGSRSSHDIPTPRGGGIGIIVGVALAAVVGTWLCGLDSNLVIWVALALIALVGWADDVLHGLPVWVRLVSQVLAAALVVGSLGALRSFPLPAPADFDLGWLGWVLSIFWIIGVTNVYNFLDGIDGYAAAQGVVAGIGLALIGGGNVAVLALAAAGACSGFLPLNWHPAKVFMGDVGSSSLGFLFAILPFLASAGQKKSSLVFAVGVLLWFFLADGAFTFLRRASRRERVWTSHRSHLYQRLVQTGLRHDQVVVSLVVGILVLTTSVTLASKLEDRLMLWGCVALALLGILGLCLWVWRREAGLPKAS